MDIHVVGIWVAVGMMALVVGGAIYILLDGYKKDLCIIIIFLLILTGIVKGFQKFIDEMSLFWSPKITVSDNNRWRSM